MQECNEFLVTKLKHFAQLVIPTGNRSLDVIDMSVEVLEVNDKTQPPGAYAPTARWRSKMYLSCGIRDRSL